MRARVLAAAMLLVSVASVAEELLAVDVQMQVLAGDREVTGRALSEWADEHGGYFTFRSFERVTLRVPDHEVARLRAFVERRGDEVVVYNPSTTDLRAELRDVEASIAARREALGEILAYLEDSDVSATLAFERELRALNAEIEQLSGRRRVLLNRDAFARVHVALSARERGIPRRLPSSFAWINEVDLYRFIDSLGEGGGR